MQQGQFDDTSNSKDSAEPSAVVPPARARRPRRSQAERTAESDQRMLRAALKLIGQRGYTGTSLAAIGEEAGYSRGLVNERFGSKDGLLWVLVKNMLRSYRRDVRASEASLCGVDRLCSILDSHRRAVELDEPIRALYALMFEAMGPIPQLQPEFQKLHQSFRGDIEKTIREGIAAGVIRADVDPASQAVLLLGALRGIAFQWLLERGAFSLEAAYSELKENLRRTFSP